MDSRDGLREVRPAADARVRLRARGSPGRSQAYTPPAGSSASNNSSSRATARAAADDATLREAERIAPPAESCWAAIEAPHLPGRDQQALAERLKAAQGVIGPRLQDLREMDEWKRFGDARCRRN